MDKERKAWCEKYKVKIADGGFIDKFCIPEHVERVLPSPESGMDIPYFIGFDGRMKMYEQLTEEEKQDYEKQLSQVPERLKKFVEEKNIEK